MRILILNRIPLRLIPYLDYLGGRGHELHLLTDTAKVREEDLPALEAGFDRIERIDNYDAGGLVELRAVELHRAAPFDRIVAVSESDLVRAGSLRDHLGIEGQGYASALAFRDKIVMKELAAQHGVRVPAFRRLASALDLVAFVEEHGLPVVVKPVLGAGSVGVTILRTPGALRDFLATAPIAPLHSAPDIEVETFVEGDMYTIDGVVVDGRIVVSWPSRYLSGCHAFTAGGVAQGMHTLGADNPLVPRLRRFVADLLDVLPTPTSTGFHAEVFHTPDDELVLCEIASRIGGPRIPEFFEVAFGFDLARAFVQGQAGVESEPPPADPLPRKLGGDLLVPARGGTLVRAPAACELDGVLDYRLTGEVGRTVKRTASMTEFVASFLLTADSEVAVRERIRAAASWFERESEWSS